jgi:hypothetical protein
MLFSRLTLACAFAFLAEDTKPTQLPHDWAVGTAYHIEFVKTREEIEEGKPVKRNSSRTPIDVEVMAKREDGYTYRWTFTKPTVETEAPLPGSLIDKITNLVDGLKLDVLADASGSITALAEPAAVDTHFERSSNVLIADLESRGGLTTAEMASLKKSLSAMKGPSFQASYLNFPRLFYMPAGASLALGEKREYEDHLPNPFGGEALPSKAYLILTKLDLDKQEAVIDWRQSIDPAQAGPILEASVRAFAKRTGQELPKEASLSFDAIEDASTYVYDIATGIPKSVVSTRTTVMAGRRRVDSHEFKVTRPAPK